MAYNHPLFRNEIKTDIFHRFAEALCDNDGDTVHIHADVFLFIKIFVYGNSKHYFGASGTADSNLTDTDEAFIVIKSFP